MATQVTNYKCPACTGPLHFAADSGKLECEYCGSVYELSEIEALYAKQNQEAEKASAKEQSEKEPIAEAEQSDNTAWDPTELNNDWGADGQNMQSYICPSCGAELICDRTTAATQCPYCGNPTVVPGQFRAELKPDFIIPFKITKKDAIETLKKHYAGKRLLPTAFSKENHLEKIQGIYVPFFLFDGQAEADITFNATRTSSYTTSKEQITETKHYVLRRSGTVDFEKIPVDASSKMPDDYMDSIEPFDYSQLKPFSMAYLPGYLADRYDVTPEETGKRADERSSATAEQRMYQDAAAGYDSCITQTKKISLHRGKVHYALLPVWVLNTQWKGQSFLFTINGQTGRVAGRLPLDRGKYWAWFAGTAAAICAVTSAILMLIF